MVCGSVACAVTRVGRVCGTAIGTPETVIRRDTSSRSARPSTAAVARFHCVSGSGPVSIRNGVPFVSRSRWITSEKSVIDTHWLVSNTICGRRER